MAELQMLLDQEIPSGRQALLESHQNLEKVATYCAHKYIEDNNKKAALEETKNYTTQSLASVAYQINTLASNMLHLLDIQAAQLSQMDSAINNISQTVDIHKEKVARREIGLLTAAKITRNNPAIMKPANQDRPTKYIRKAVDFSELDGIGHGAKPVSHSNSGAGRRPSATPSISKSSVTSSLDGATGRRESTRSTSSHGTLRAVKAPTVPQEYSSNGQQRLSALFHHRTNSNSSSESGSQGIPVAVPSVPASIPPPTIHPSPMSYHTTPDMNSHRGNLRNAHLPPIIPAVPPPPPPDSAGYKKPNLANVYAPPYVGGGVNQDNYSAKLNFGNPPPPQSMNMEVLPPPPPPPDAVSLVSSGGESSVAGFALEPDWVPKNYLEKMIVIYDYSANNPDELNLKEDQIVYVVKKNDDGWFEGVLDGVTGLFPGNYAERVTA